MPVRRRLPVSYCGSVIEPIELPELWQAELPLREAIDMLETIEAQAEILEVSEKRAARSMADGPEARDLEAVSSQFRQARERLLVGEVRGIQVLYRFQGRTFSDTFLRIGESVRAVRMDVSERR